MTTLTLLKADIADDLDRTDLTSAIASEISSAIRHYQNTRFYFNETRDETFATVAAQKLYSSSDDTAIPKFIEIDQISILDGSEFLELDQMDPREWEALTANGTTTGRPTDYCIYDQKIGLYPVPDAIYTVRMAGQFMKAAPASDGEANNVWMTEAFDLLRARVVSRLGLRKIRGQEGIELARIRSEDEKAELQRLLSETASRVGTGYMVPTEF